MNNNLKKFPKIIGKYKYRCMYDNGVDSRISKFALYANNNGEVALGKMSVKTGRFWEKYWLRNEYQIYQVLNAYLPKFKNITTPKLLGYYECREYSVILLTLVVGKNIENGSTMSKLKAIDSVLDYLENVNQNSLFANDSKILTRSGLYFVLLFPIRVVLSYIKHPEIRKYVGGAIKIYISSIVQTICNSKILFVHRDLNGENIIFSQNKLWIIDFQSSLFADIRFELANIAINLWHDKITRKYYYGIRGISKILNTESDLKIYKFYSLYGAFYEISQKNHKIESWLVNYLKHIFSLSFNLSGKIRYD